MGKNINVKHTQKAGWTQHLFDIAGAVLDGKPGDTITIINRSNKVRRTLKIQ